MAVFLKIFKGFVYICCLFLFFAMVLAFQNSKLTLESAIGFIVLIVFLIALVNIKDEKNLDNNQIVKHRRKYEVSEKTYRLLWKLLFIITISLMIVGFVVKGVLILMPLMGLAMLILKFYIEVENKL